MSYASALILVLVLSGEVQAAPRLPTSPGSLVYTIEPVKPEIVPVPAPPPTESADDAAAAPRLLPSQTGNNVIDFLGKFFQENDIVGSLFRMVGKATEASMAAKRAADEADENREFPASTKNKALAAKNSASPALLLDDAGDLASSIDSEPVAVSEQGPDFLGLDWKNTLFGPKGLLTEVFHFVNEKRKQGFDKPVVPASQSDLTPPAAPAGAAGALDFGKVFDALLFKSGDGGFDEPKLPELPFIGICDRLSCGDIYKAVDEFKKSELFSNFQTALSLVNDPKGWDIIGELLENPELIEQFAGKSSNNVGDLLNKIAPMGSKTGGAAGKSGNGLNVLPTDGDLGTDFSSQIDGAPEHSIGSSIDSGAGSAKTGAGSGGDADYYSAVESSKPDPDHEDVDYEEPVSVDIEEVISTTRAPTTTTVSLPPVEAAKKIPELPEISFSEDGPGGDNDDDDEFGDYDGPRVIEVEETMSPKVSSRFVSPTTTTKKPQATASVTPAKTTTTKHPKAAVAAVRQPKGPNFRQSNDYYSMYYDN